MTITSDRNNKNNSPNAPKPLAPKAYIVGAGPGDPDLLTIKAQKLLAQADVILYANSLVPKQILAICRPDAEKIGTANMTLEEILPLTIERVRSGLSVVRLHSGDPSLYSAIYEQMQVLAEADIPFEVIPGISAFQAAAAKLNVELTVPALVQTIILTRISGRASAVPNSEELASLAAHQASLCLYLGARHVDSAREKLLQHYPADTPVAICYRVGWPDEQIWLVPLEQMAAITHEEKLIRTVLYIVSPALASAHFQTGTEAIAGDPMGIEQEATPTRSRLYHPEHAHLFRQR